jgi:hypothetical protein
MMNMKQSLTVSLLIVMLLAVLCSCGMEKKEMSKENITTLINENRKLLDEAVDDTKNLDPYVTFISTTQKSKIDTSNEKSKKYADINGLYQAGLKSGDYIYEKLEMDSFLRVLKLNGIQSISIHQEKGYVEFDCGGSGFGPSTEYRGFYYSANGKPNGLDFIGEKPPENEDSWSYRQQNGDNKYDTQRIQGNWFCYEAGF